jgi:hypothetical protein
MCPEVRLRGQVFLTITAIQNSNTEIKWNDWAKVGRKMAAGATVIRDSVISAKCSGWEWNNAEVQCQGWQRAHICVVRCCCTPEINSWKSSGVWPGLGGGDAGWYQVISRPQELHCTLLQNKYCWKDLKKRITVDIRLFSPYINVLVCNFYTETVYSTC